MSNEVREKRAAEEGYRTVGQHELQWREWLSLQEKDGPATAWLKRFAPEEVAKREPIPCGWCDSPICPIGKAGKPKKHCSLRCLRKATMARFRRNVYSDSARLTVFREKNKLGSRRHRAADPQRYHAHNIAWQKRLKQKLRTRKTVFTCIDCAKSWLTINGLLRVVSPRCDECRSVHALSRRRARDAVDSKHRKKKPATGNVNSFQLGDWVSWKTLRGLSTSTKTGYVLAIVPANTSVRSAIKQQSIGVFRANVMINSLDLVRSGDSYLVKIGKRLYWPLAEWLRRTAAPAIAQIHPASSTASKAPSPAGFVKVRKRMAA